MSLGPRIKEVSTLGVTSQRLITLYDTDAERADVGVVNGSMGKPMAVPSLIATSIPESVFGRSEAPN